MLNITEQDLIETEEDLLNTEVNTVEDYYEYDDGDTNWLAEEEADATERLEYRYGTPWDN